MSWSSSANSYKLSISRAHCSVWIVSNIVPMSLDLLFVSLPLSFIRIFIMMQQATGVYGTERSNWYTVKYITAYISFSVCMFLLSLESSPDSVFYLLLLWTVCQLHINQWLDNKPAAWCSQLINSYTDKINRQNTNYITVLLLLYSKWTNWIKHINMNTLPKRVEEWNLATV